MKYNEIEEDDVEIENEEDHFESTYHLKENIEYEANGYHYKTDKEGRICEASGNLYLGEGKRNTNHQTKAGFEDRCEDDEGGHLIGKRFNGSEKVDNIVAMDYDINRNVYKKLEDSWEQELKDGNQVEVDIKLHYIDDSQRPDKIQVMYKVTDSKGNSVYNIKAFRNEAGGTI